MSVDDAADYEAGGTLRFWDVSAGTYEDETIASVDVEAGTVTVSTAPTASFKAGEDFVEMTKPFLPTNKFLMFADTIEGQKTMEWMNAPFGLNRNYGMYVDQNENWDPEVVWIRVQNKGLPVLYQEDAFYALTVAKRPREGIMARLLGPRPNMAFAEQVQVAREALVGCTAADHGGVLGSWRRSS